MNNDDAYLPTDSHLQPDPHHKIHWAQGPLEEKIEALKARNWISEDLIDFSRKHWHCSREKALERLLDQAK